MNKEYNGRYMTIVLQVPENATKLKVTAIVDENGEEKKLRIKLNKKDIFELREDYLILDPDDTLYALYKINPEFKQFMDIGLQLGKTEEQVLDAWEEYYREKHGRTEEQNN